MSYRGNMNSSRLIRGCLVMGVLAGVLVGSGCQRLTELATPPTPTASAAPVPQGATCVRYRRVEGCLWGGVRGARDGLSSFPLRAVRGTWTCRRMAALSYATMSKSDQVMVYEDDRTSAGVGLRWAEIRRPWCWSTRDERHWVANRGSRDVSVVDLAKRRELRRIPTPGGAI